MKDNELGRYHIENMKNKLAAANNQSTRYMPLSTKQTDGPKIEVTINQVAKNKNSFFFSLLYNILWFKKIVEQFSKLINCSFAIHIDLLAI